MQNLAPSHSIVQILLSPQTLTHKLAPVLRLRLARRVAGTQTVTSAFRQAWHCQDATSFCSQCHRSPKCQGHAGLSPLDLSKAPPGDGAAAPGSAQEPICPSVPVYAGFRQSWGTGLFGSLAVSKAPNCLLNARHVREQKGKCPLT